MKSKVLISILILVVWTTPLLAVDFINNNDGTVTDHDTHLMWMQATSETTMTWKEALAYCENLTLAGYSDWRLPNIKELRSIIDYGTYNPAIDKTYFPDTRSPSYWTSTTNAFNTGLAWHVNCLYGNDFRDSKYSSYYVRAVRGGH